MGTLNRQILRLALPSIVSNITVPLLGLVDVAIVGHMGSPAYIGAISVGSMIFNVIYWVFGFLRMGTSGLTSQALGRRDLTAVVQMLCRSVTVGLVVALMIIVLQSTGPECGCSRTRNQPAGGDLLQYLRVGSTCHVGSFWTYRLVYRDAEYACPNGGFHLPECGQYRGQLVPRLWMRHEGGRGGSWHVDCPIRGSGTVCVPVVKILLKIDKILQTGRIV